MFSNNSYAKVWEVTEKTNEKTGKTTKQMRISTSRKNDDGTYTQDFGGFVVLRGKAAEKPIADNDRIQLLNVGVTNSYDKAKDTTYTNFICFDFVTNAELDAKRENGGGNTSNANKNASTANATPTASNDVPSDSDFINIPDGIDEELPFA
jgi:hypothetical protein